MASGVSKRHFIIADEDRDVRYLLRCIVLRAAPDAELTEAADAVEALAAFNLRGADLVVVDRELPAPDGLQVIRELRRRAASLPIVVISLSPGAREEAIAAGATVFFEKQSLQPAFGRSLPQLLKAA